MTRSRLRGQRGAASSVTAGRRIAPQQRQRDRDDQAAEQAFHFDTVNTATELQVYGHTR